MLQELSAERRKRLKSGNHDFPVPANFGLGHALARVRPDGGSDLIFVKAVTMAVTGEPGGPTATCRLRA